MFCLHRFGTQYYFLSHLKAKKNSIQDCFYVSVERHDNPNLNGKKIIICPTNNLQTSSLIKSTSEVASASYEARRCGVKSRMFVKDAFRLCPDAVFLPCNYKRYEEASDLFYEVLLKFTRKIQPMSADEAVLDFSLCGLSEIEPLLSEIRSQILAATGCPSSAGVGENLLLAKLATRKAKPNGQFIVHPHEVSSFLADIPVSELPKVGEVTTSRLKQQNIHTIADLSAQSLVFPPFSFSFLQIHFLILLLHLGGSPTGLW